MAAVYLEFFLQKQNNAALLLSLCQYKVYFQGDIKEKGSVLYHLFYLHYQAPAEVRTSVYWIATIQ